MPTLTLEPGGYHFEAAEGETILSVLRRSGFELRTDCEFGYCGTDPVIVMSGMASLSAPEDDEIDNLTHNKFPQDVRMACVARLNADVTIRLFNAPDVGTAIG